MYFDCMSAAFDHLAPLAFRTYNLHVHEWNGAKRIANLRKRRLDFIDARLVYEHPGKVTIDSPRHEELRQTDLALVKIRGRVLALTYTMRGENVRCISYRYASREERMIDEAFKP